MTRLADLACDISRNGLDGLSFWKSEKVGLFDGSQVTTEYFMGTRGGVKFGALVALKISRM
jgi:hypothetical protein